MPPSLPKLKWAPSVSNNMSFERLMFARALKDEVKLFHSDFFSLAFSDGITIRRGKRLVFLIGADLSAVIAAGRNSNFVASGYGLTACMLFSHREAEIEVLDLIDQGFSMLKLQSVVQGLHLRSVVE